jgi:GTP-binding protein HflX
VDGSSPVRMEQIEQVNEVLREIGADHIPQILVWNKIDAAGLEPAVERDQYAKISRVFISAQSGAGLDLLRDAIAEAAKTAPARSHLFDAEQHAGQANGTDDADDEFADDFAGELADEFDGDDASHTDPDDPIPTSSPAEPR